MSDWQGLASSAWQRSLHDLSSARRKQWVVAMITTKHGVTCTDDDTATKLRGGWAMFTFISHYLPSSARRMRALYSYRRFYDLFLEWRKYEFSAEECIEHLQFEGGNKAMVMQVVDVHDTRPEWLRRAFGVYGNIDKLVTDLDCDPEIVEWAKQGKEIMTRKGIR